MTVLSEQIKIYQQSVENALDVWLPDASIQPERLHKAMRYSVLSDGKRIRPILLYATGRALGIDMKLLNGPACAVEITHAYSLIHDDLPSMDNDDLRRGRPTCHNAFDEATAILAGDALQALAFHILAYDPDIMVSCAKRLLMINTLSMSIGSHGMVGGQAIDLESVGKSLNIAELENMHIHKTGALIKASTELGALSSDDIKEEQLLSISKYAKCIGLAFQIRDDILDVEVDTETLGKPQGSDRLMNKPTYPDLLGLDGAKQAAKDLCDEATRCLSFFDERADVLRQIASYIVKREK